MTDSLDGLPRRGFLKLTGASAAAAGVSSAAAQTRPTAAAASAQPASAAALDQHETDPSPGVAASGPVRVGSDYMVDVIKALGIEYVAATCGSSFRSLQESITVYGNNSAPEYLTCMHEEASVAIGHGYAKIEGKPIAVLLHNNVGIQHASMAIFNAFADRAPVLMFAGNTLDSTARRGGAEGYHSATDVAVLVRPFVKWDDQPVSLAHFAESTVRAHKVAMTPPFGPTLITIDKELQERSSQRAAEPRKPALQRPSFPAAERGAIDALAAALVAAEAPVLVAERIARSQAGADLLVTLAELLQCAVLPVEGSPFSFPQLHPLNQSLAARETLRGADLVLGLETSDLWAAVYTMPDRIPFIAQRVAPENARVMSLGVSDFQLRSASNAYQRFLELDLDIVADGEASLPALIDAVRRRLNRGRRGAIAQRGQRLADVKRARMDRLWSDAAYGWDASPISTRRLSYEVWNVVKDKDWSLAHCPRGFTSFWDKKRVYHDLGRSGGSGVGYAAPASVGAALANRKHGRFTVTIQPDGDLMFSPGVLWTAAHHRIPLLSVMHNNRAYHQEVMHLQRMACEHNRGIDRCTIGTTIDNPNIDYAALARAMGVYSEGPISDPADLAAALRRATAVVERGEPALVDVVCEPR
jgi:thiamine pyrophosphate-dependent acetolactate synthase large subunit-like protein